MRWQHRLLVAALAWVFLVAPARAQTAQDALKVVPAKAAGFVIVSNLGEFSAKVESLAKRIGMPLPFSLLEKLKSETGIDQGLNGKGAVMVVMLLAQDGFHPLPLIYVPVTDYAQFLKGLNGTADGAIATVKVHNGTQEMIVGQKGSFAVLAKPEHREDLKDALQGKATANKAGPSATSGGPERHHRRAHEPRRQDVVRQSARGPGHGQKRPGAASGSVHDGLV